MKISFDPGSIHKLSHSRVSLPLLRVGPAPPALLGPPVAAAVAGLV